MSIQRTKSFTFLTEQGFTMLGLLFLPAKWSRWWRLVLISATVGGLMNISTDFISNMPDAQAAPYSVMTTEMTSPAGQTVDHPTQALQAGLANWLLIGSDLEPWFVYSTIGLLLILALTIDYFQARFRFVMLDVIRTKDVSIMGPYKAHKRVGHSFFKWLFFMRWSLYGLWALALTLTIAGWREAYAEVNFIPTSEFLTLHEQAMGLQILYFSASLIAILSFLSIFFYIARAYVLPIMLLKQIPFKTALKTAMRIIRENKMEAFKTLAWRLMMMAIAGIAVSIIAVVLFILCLVPMVIFIYIGLLLHPIFSLILYAAAACCFFLLMFLYLLLSGLPQYWARAFDMFYLKSLNIGYDFLPYSDKENYSKRK